MAPAGEVVGAVGVELDGLVEALHGLLELVLLAELDALLEGGLGVGGFAVFGQGRRGGFGSGLGSRARRRGSGFLGHGRGVGGRCGSRAFRGFLDRLGLAFGQGHGQLLPGVQLPAHVGIEPGELLGADVELAGHGIHRVLAVGGVGRGGGFGFRGLVGRLGLRLFRGFGLGRGGSAAGQGEFLAHAQAVGLEALVGLEQVVHGHAVLAGDASEGVALLDGVVAAGFGGLGLALLFLLAVPGFGGAFPGRGRFGFLVGLFLFRVLGLFGLGRGAAGNGQRFADFHLAGLEALVGLEQVVHGDVVLLGYGQRRVAGLHSIGPGGIGAGGGDQAQGDKG